MLHVADIALTLSQHHSITCLPEILIGFRRKRGILTHLRRSIPNYTSGWLLVLITSRAQLSTGGLPAKLHQCLASYADK